MPGSEARHAGSPWSTGWGVRAPHVGDVDRAVEMLNARSQKLDVDPNSLAVALRVSERVGMQVVRQSIAYEKELCLGIDLATRRLAS